MMMTIAGGDADDDSHRRPAPSASALATSAENWDDDFEFQGDDAPPPEHLPDAIHAPSPSTHNEEQEESWDDAYADDDAPSSPIRRADGVVHADEEVEDWDSSDNEAEHPNSTGQEFGLGGFEEEDKTVTAKSNSGRRPRDSPPPPLPVIPPFHTLPSTTHQNLQAIYNASSPLPAVSPTLSSFSIPLSSQRDHASIYSQDPLLRSSSGSAPHLTIMRSYPHAAGSTPPRRSRRLKKKSRPPEADIFELEDREPEPPQSRVDLTAKRSSNHLALPPSTPPSDSQQSPAPPSSPASSPSLLSRIGSFKRWARRSIGPDDPSFSGWRRSRSSTGPPDMRAPKSSQGPKSSTSPEDVLMEEITQNLSVTPAPAASASKTRTRGASASGLKSGWFFRAGGTAGNGSHHNQEVTPVPPSLAQPPATQAEMSLLSTPQKKGGLSPLRKRGASGKTKEKEAAEADEREGLTPTPRKARGNLVPILRGKAKSPKRPEKNETSSSRPISMIQQNGGPSTQVFPRHAASMGRHSGVAMAPTASGVTEQENGKGKEKENSSGMRSLINGVRRLSLVGQGHKRTKSGGGNGSMDTAAARCSYEADRNGKHRESTSTDILDLNSPYLAGRRGSLPWLDHSPPTQHVKYERHSHEGMERFSFGEPPNGYIPPPSPTSHPKHPAGSPPRPKPLRLTAATATPLPVLPPSPSAFRTTTLRPESAASNHRSDASRIPSSSSGSRNSDSRPRTPNHNSRPRTPTRTTQPRPVTPLTQRPVSPLTQRPPPIVTSAHGQQTPTFAGQSASLGRTTSPHASRTAVPPTTTASLGRSSSQSSHSGLKRNSLNDLKRTPSMLGDHKPVLTTLGENKALDERVPSSEQRHRSLEERKASVNTLSELKIPARISRAQQGLRRDLGMVREFAGCVEQLKTLQATYRKLIGELCVAYESYPVARPPSRPPSQMAARSTSRLASNPNPSVQSFNQCHAATSPTGKSRSVSRASSDLHRELARLEHEYGLWWECAELLVDLGGGSSAATAAAGSVSNPNLSHHSSSSVLNMSPEDVSSATSGRFPAHVPSKSDPGLLLDTHYGSGRGPPQASQTQWRASTGRHDLSARQLKLLRDMLNTPDPASLADSAVMYGYGLGPDGFVYPGTEGQPWNHWNASNVTLPSEESSADIDDTVDPAKEARKKEKKRRVSKLGILGLRDLLRGLKKKAVAEGRLPQRSESSLDSNPEDDFYNRRRSPWHQHDAHHVREVPEPILVPMPVHVPPPPKSPRRPSLASIFRIGYKNSKNTGKKDDTPPSATHRSSTTEDDQDVGGDWDRMSQSDLDLSAPPPGTATVRGRKNVSRPPSSFSNTHLAKHPYGYGHNTPKKKNAVASRTSLREASPTAETDDDGTHPSAGTTRPGKHRTASWSQAAASPSSRPSSRHGRAPISGTVRSAPPADLSLSEPPSHKLALTPDTIKPLLEYAKEVSSRLADCISEVEGLLGVAP